MYNSGLIAQKKPDKRSLRTKQALTKGLFTLLENKEFRKISVNDICTAASVSRPTFYTYFEDKYSLLNYCVGTVFHELLKLPLTADTPDNTVIEQTFEMLFPCRRIIANCMSPGICLTSEQGAMPLPVEGDLPAQLVTLYRLGGTFVAFCWWSMYGKSIPREEFIHQLTEMLESEDSA